MDWPIALKEVAEEWTGPLFTEGGVSGTWLIVGRGEGDGVIHHSWGRGRGQKWKRPEPLPPGGKTVDWPTAGGSEGSGLTHCLQEGSESSLTHYSKWDGGRERNGLTHSPHEGRVEVELS